MGVGTSFVYPNRLDKNVRHDDSWTGQRSMDGMRVHTDYFLRFVQLHWVQVKYDFAMPIGLDQRCVHCTMKISFRKNGFENRLVSSAGAPFYMNMGIPQVTNNTFEKRIASSSTSTASDLAKQFAESWCETWHFKAANDCFFSIRTFATFECCTQPNNAFAERFQFAHPTNSLARIETAEIKSIKRLLGQPQPVERSQ